MLTPGKTPEAKAAKLRKEHFTDAMARLLDTNKIHGPPCRATYKLAPGPKP
jgi:hypothetical protein